MYNFMFLTTTLSISSTVKVKNYFCLLEISDIKPNILKWGLITQHVLHEATNKLLNGLITLIRVRYVYFICAAVLEISKSAK